MIRQGINGFGSINKKFEENIERFVCPDDPREWNFASPQDGTPKKSSKIYGWSCFDENPETCQKVDNLRS